MSELMSKRVWAVYLLSVGVYLLLSFMMPVEAEVLQRYGLTSLQANLLKPTVVIPLLIIWLAAFYGFDRFKNYARSISSSPDGKAFNQIANGLGVLAISLPASSIISNFFEYFERGSEDFVPTATIITNYVTILFALAAFWLIYRGSRALVGITKQPKNTVYNELPTVAGLGLAAVYAFLTFQNPGRQVAIDGAEAATYYLPDPLILLTIILPYTFIWLVGLQAAANLIRYTNMVQGVLYKQMLNYLAAGVAGIILVSILLQFIKDFSTLFLTFSLTPLLIIIYALIAALAFGYVLVAAGAKRLQKIEEA